MRSMKGVPHREVGADPGPAVQARKGPEFGLTSVVRKWPSRLNPIVYLYGAGTAVWRGCAAKSPGLAQSLEGFECKDFRPDFLDSLTESPARHVGDRDPNSQPRSRAER